MHSQSKPLQVLSKSIANALDFYGGSETEETRIFVETFDKFFDCLNVRSLQEHFKRRKPNLAPYRDPDDERLTVSANSLCRLVWWPNVSACIHTLNVILYFQWLECDFLGYLAAWRDSVETDYPDLSKREKGTMCLSKETLEGLHITGK